MGESYRDSSIEDRTTTLPTFSETRFPPSYQPLIQQLVASLHDGQCVQLWGSNLSTQHAISAVACQELGCLGKTLSLSIFPLETVDWRQWQRRWQQEVRLNRSLLVIDARSLDGQPCDRLANFDRWLAGFETPLLLLTAKPLSFDTLLSKNLQIPPLNLDERQHLWLAYLGEKWQGRLDRLVAQFDLTPTEIHSIGSSLKQEAIDEADLEAKLWKACREQARPQLDAVATRVKTSLSWDDLILPKEQIATLKNIVTYVDRRIQVYDRWGIAKRSERGLGISALFSGGSGTGKTTAAEIMAKELNLDCYRIDLSSVISKYIGETEKNLSRIFEVAETAGAVLLFDEADALFGKRGEVREARDRYANQEVSYLLQRMETYPGLAILTTNIPSALDSAFERRVKFIVKFPFPDFEERQKIWERVFPPQAPTKNLDYKKLSKLNVTGGVISNLAVDAAFRAAREGSSIEMRHIKEAAIADSQKTGRYIPQNSDR